MHALPPQAIALVQKYEGCKLRAYPDKGWSIGWGHHSPEIQHDTVWTQKEADEMLLVDMNLAAGYIGELVKVKLNDNQLSALISFVYNVGRANFAKSGVLKVLNRGEYKHVPEHLVLWNKSGMYVIPQLTERRKAECALYLKVE